VRAAVAPQYAGSAASVESVPPCRGGVRPIVRSTTIVGVAFDPPLPPHAPEHAGIGSLLMTDGDLPGDEFGRPYQPCFYFDGDSKPLGLVLDHEGYVLGWQNNAEGDPLAGDTWAMQRMPHVVAAAAEAWLTEHRPEATS
jgi:hypothetical protein